MNFSSDQALALAPGANSVKAAKKLAKPSPWHTHHGRLLVVAQCLGLRSEQVDLRSSGDTAGDPDRVVGYGAFAFNPAGEA